MAFSIYDILTEAPNDGEQQPNNNQQSDNFNIDASLDSPEDTENPQQADQDGDGQPDEISGNENDDDEEQMQDDGDTGQDTESMDEPVPANTDIFSSLTADEQKIKISELKRLYASLYNSCDDLIEKVNMIENNEYNITAISKINTTLTSLKTYIADYLYHSFANKSYYENDVMLNRFLSIFKSISNILEDMYRVNKKNLQNSD